LFSDGSKELAEFLQECRGNDDECDRPLCSICARKFRRWFIGELLRVTKGHDRVHVYTVLLRTAPRDEINTLDPDGFEITYMAKTQSRMLHANLVMIGGERTPARSARSLEPMTLNAGRSDEIEG
jgi:hypothetical protein